MQEKRKNVSRQARKGNKQKFLLEDFSSSRTMHENRKENNKADKALHLSMPCSKLPLMETEVLDVLKTRIKKSRKKTDNALEQIKIIQEKYNEIKPPPSHITKKYLKSARNTTETEQEVNYNSFHTSIRRVETDRLESIWCVALAPVHLKGLETIGKIFGKSKNTVRSWCNKGAPIAYDGSSYCTEYLSLFTWYLDFCNRQDKI